eukprot:807236-Rhodomonas_salina.3
MSAAGLPPPPSASMRSTQLVCGGRGDSWRMPGEDGGELKGGRGLEAGGLKGRGRVEGMRGGGTVRQ